MMMIFKGPGTDLESNLNLSTFFSVENWCQRDDRLSIALQRPELPICADQQQTGLQEQQARLYCLDTPAPDRRGGQRPDEQEDHGLQSVISRCRSVHAIL